MLPPPLAWVENFVASTGLALGTSISYSFEETVNPLVLKLAFTFGEPISGKSFMLVWNLFQKWAAKNEVIPQGKLESEGKKLTVKVIIKRRFGEPRADHPMG